MQALFKHEGSLCLCSGDRGDSDLPAGRQGIVLTDPGIPAEQSAGLPSADGKLEAMATKPATVAVVVDTVVATPPDTFPVWE